MIDWGKTKTDNDKTKKTDKIVVICDECKHVRTITYASWKNQIRLRGNDNCSSCRSKANRLKYFR